MILIIFLYISLLVGSHPSLPWLAVVHSVVVTEEVIGSSHFTQASLQCSVCPADTNIHQNQVKQWLLPQEDKRYMTNCALLDGMLYWLFKIRAHI